MKLNGKPIELKDIKKEILCVLLYLFPISSFAFAIINLKKKIAKIINTTADHAFIISFIIALAIGLLFLILLNKEFEKEESLKHKEKDSSHLITNTLRNSLEAETACTNEFEDFIRNNPPKGFTVETFDLTKEINQPSVASGVNPILSDLINQIQTHGDNIIVKQQGQQLTIKATLNKNNQNKNNPWGDF